jgi:hypothetical protein
MAQRLTPTELAELNSLIPLENWGGEILTDADKAHARAIASKIIADAETTFADAAQAFLAQSDTAESEDDLTGPARVWFEANRAVTAAFPGVSLFIGFYQDIYHPDAALFYDRDGVMHTTS